MQTDTGSYGSDRRAIELTDFVLTLLIADRLGSVVVITRLPFCIISLPRLTGMPRSKLPEGLSHIM